nr:MAG TPA: hypothetical protein [Caudoviricetes sp.]
MSHCLVFLAIFGRKSVVIKLCNNGLNYFFTRD